ncbi:hypothetical protein jhhlp_001309 [Lomentospora prolificans]|uniref:Xylose isomerase-like TIM barrel domain-containing protein n=1 Tax=Lomentospora prolificans TaxID=41688 RepID=A0A2N3NHV6_9PEZI|nr:hypothetical protein jhhlp_001309 [Lomentospora prolificans]
MSMGHPSKHDLTRKLRKAAQAGFKGVELFWDDLDAFCSQTFGNTAGGALLKACQQLKLLCDELGLEVVSLQPFRNFDGLVDKAEKEQRLEEFKLWLLCATHLGAGIIGVPATIEKEGHSTSSIVEDICQLSSLAQQNAPPITVAYENLCFSAFIETWESAWSVVHNASRGHDNVAIILDTFNIGGGMWADPCAPEGLRPNHRDSLETCLRDLAATIPRHKVALIQVADAELLDPPIQKGHALYDPESASCLRNWSRNCRLFPLEKDRGAYLPIVELLRAMTDGDQNSGMRGIGYEGWISMEVFSKSTETPGQQCVDEHVERAWAGWIKLRESMGWEDC